MTQENIQRPSAEHRYADELTKLAQRDSNKPRPAGWHLTPQSVLAFVLGDKALSIQPKFVGSRNLIERCIVALATQRGLMLIGEPGTAKSYLSELLTAAISGDSTLTIQGSAGTTEDSIKYSWNYALLLAEGPTERAMVPAPLYLGMKYGKIVRFEEITRCPLEVQDTLLSVLSDRVLIVPELTGSDRVVYAKNGFSVIATANTRDRGVNEMSSALKRRFNFETVHPIPNLQQEMELVKRETDMLLSQAGIPLQLPDNITEILVTTFHELREGHTAEGDSLPTLSTVMSTAEAVSVGVAAGIHAYYYGQQTITPDYIVQGLIGSALKESGEDVKKLRNYFTQTVRNRKGSHWQAYYQARRYLEE